MVASILLFAGYIKFDFIRRKMVTKFLFFRIIIRNIHKTVTKNIRKIPGIKAK